MPRILSTQYRIAMNAAKSCKAWEEQLGPVQLPEQSMKLKHKGHLPIAGTRGKELLSLDRGAKKYDTFPCGDNGVVTAGFSGKVKIRRRQSPVA